MKALATKDLAGSVLLAVLLGTLPILLFLHAPIVYAQIVAEDFFGEYATAAAFAGAGLLFLYDVLHAPARGRKAVSLLMALVAILIAGEEVSWGQRVLGLATPEALLAANKQQELNVHNLEVIGLSNETYHWGARLLLAWLALSALMSLCARDKAARLREAGVPLVPLRLVPVCATPTLFFLFRPVAQPFEVGELLLGLAALLFALDRAWPSAPAFSPRLPTRAAAAAGSLATVALIGLGLAALTPLEWMSWRLQTLAVRDYPPFGLYDQAERIFDYIYAHPDQLLRDDTRLSHAELLAGAGRLDQAREILDRVVGDTEGSPGGDRLRRIAELQARLGREQEARQTFEAALAADWRALEEAEGDQRARLQLSLARTLKAQGLLREAVDMAGEAYQAATLAQTRAQIASWLDDLSAAAREPGNGTLERTGGLRPASVE